MPSTGHYSLRQGRRGRGLRLLASWSEKQTKPRAITSLAITLEALEAADLRAEQEGTTRATVLRTIVESTLCPSVVGAFIGVSDDRRAPQQE